MTLWSEDRAEINRAIENHLRVIAKEVVYIPSPER